jgi:hypothetical protein
VFPSAHGKRRALPVGVQHHRFILVAALASTSALVLGACVVDTDTGAPGTDTVANAAEPEPIGDAEEAVGPMMPLPHTGKFEMAKLFNSPHFVLTVRSSITFEAHASWSAPGICQGSGYAITMMNANGASEGSKNYLISSHEDVQSFQNLPPGEYYFRAEVQQRNPPQCVLTVFFNIHHT